MPTKKKKNKAIKQEAAVSCVQCAQGVSEKGAIHCVCTRVLFCSESCQNKALSAGGAHTCPGPPDSKVDVARMARIVAQDQSGFSQDPNVHEEIQRTVISKMGLGQPGGPQKSELAEYVRCADSGNVACAYQAGIAYKHRLQGTAEVSAAGSVIYDAAGTEQLGVLNTNELSVKYLQQAADGGLGVAMQSLADNLETGVGVREDRRASLEYYWRACLIKSSGAQKALEERSIIVKEHRATSEMLGGAHRQLRPGQAFQLSGPNLASLLLALWEDLEDIGYKLAPFDAVVPTLRVNPPGHSGSVQAPLLGAKELKNIVKLLRSLKDQGFIPLPTYGRRGTSAQATALSLGAAVRPLDSQRFVVPPAPAANDLSDEAKQATWKRLAASTPFAAVCSHPESKGNRSPFCLSCLQEAKERLQAVAAGAVLLSLTEEVDDRGHMAIYRRSDGKVVSESFKDYGRGEVEVSLAAVVASQFRMTLAHPLFIAQDPNLLWLLVLSHGCVRAALQYVAPHVDWEEELGKSLALPARTPLFEATAPGDLLLRCGATACLKFEVEAHAFRKCGRCRRRRYCSDACCSSDWALHKGECKQAAAGSSEPKPLRTRTASEQGTAWRPTPAVGEEVLLHSLKAKPELNHKIGVLEGVQTDAGRYPTRVDGVLIAIKPDNFYRVGVKAVSKPGEEQAAPKLLCSQHEKEACLHCELELGIANHLIHMQQASSEELSEDAVERVVEAHFAKNQRDWKDGEVHNLAGDNEPVECQGLTDPVGKALLRTALSLGKPSLLVAAAIAGMSCYSAQRLVVARPAALRHLRHLCVLLRIQTAAPTSATPVSGKQVE